MRKILSLVLMYCFTPGTAQHYLCPDSESQKREDSTLIKITRLKSNSAQPDFSPVLHNGKLYFVSGRSTKTGVEYKDINNQNEITDLFQVQLLDSVKTGKAHPIDGALNTKYYEGPFCFTKDGQQIFFTGNDRRSAFLKIFNARQENNRWTKPEVLKFCTDSFSYCHPALSKNNDTLWFSSNKSGGQGGMDLYYSVYSNDAWQEPVNAPVPVNSQANELFPFLSSSNIFFSSNRPGGKGGLDLYKTLNGPVLTVTLLPHPFNSSADDFGFCTDSTLLKGYFSSNRNPKYQDDIFYFSNSFPDFYDAKKLTPKKRFCYSFFEEGTKEMRDTVTFEFEWDFGDGQKALGSETKHCYNAPGAYDVKLNIIQKWSGELFKNQTAYTLTIDTPATFFIEGPETVRADSCQQLRYIVRGFGNYSIQNAYWDFGDQRFNTGKTVDHVFRKPGEYTVKVFLLAKDIAKNKTVKFTAEKIIVSKD